MLEVSGQVVIHETGAGIANLVVRVYLIDATEDGPEKNALTKAALLRFGALISSAVTSVDGTFDFSAEDPVSREKEALAQLAIAVCAPEDVLDVSARRVAPPEHGMLSVTLFPRVEAGARIALPIRIAKEIVDPFLISADESQVRTGLDRTWAARDAAASTLKTRHLAELERRHEARTHAKKAVSKLNAVPIALRSHPFLVTNRAELGQPVERQRKSRAMTTLELLQENSMIAGLIKWRRQKRKRRSRLYLKDDDWKELGLTYQNGVLSDSKTTLKKLDALTLRLNGGTDLVLKKTRDASLLNALALKYLKVPPPAQTPRSKPTSTKKGSARRSAKVTKRRARRSKSGGKA
jgi:hypothetical protein